MLEIAPHGWVNLHFSLLPRWRGAAPVQAAIQAGDAETGATTFRIDEGLDTGEILGTLKETIRVEDTADDLLTRLAYAGADLLVETMTGLEQGSITPTVQEGDPSYAPKIATEDARIDWEKPAALIERAIRAHTPGPGAWTTWNQQRVKVGPVRPSAEDSLAPGEVRVEKNAVHVGTGTQDVVLGTVQPPGKKRMLAADWGRGLHSDVVDKGVMFE